MLTLLVITLLVLKLWWLDYLESTIILGGGTIGVDTWPIVNPALGNLSTSIEVLIYPGFIYGFYMIAPVEPVYWVGFGVVLH